MADVQKTNGKSPAPKAPAKAPAKEESFKGKNFKDHPMFARPGDHSNPGTISSRLDHQAWVSYEGESIMIPPRGKVYVGNTKMLGALPKGVVIMKPLQLVK